MNEKDLVILEQYDLHVQSTRRGRGSFLCDTDRGLVQVTEFSGSQERLFFQNRVLFFSDRKRDTLRSAPGKYRRKSGHF